MWLSFQLLQCKLQKVLCRTVFFDSSPSEERGAKLSAGEMRCSSKLYVNNEISHLVWVYARNWQIKVWRMMLNSKYEYDDDDCLLAINSNHFHIKFLLLFTSLAMNLNFGFILYDACGITQPMLWIETNETKINSVHLGFFFAPQNNKNATHTIEDGIYWVCKSKCTQ